MRDFFVRWMVTAVSVVAAAHWVPGIACQGVGALMAASLLLGLVNAVIKPILVVITLPILVSTFGLFLLVINTVLFYLVGKVLVGFHVDGWRAAFWGSLVCSVISLLARGLRFMARRGAAVKIARKPGSRHNQGRVIDV